MVAAAVCVPPARARAWRARAGAAAPPPALEVLLLPCVAVEYFPPPGELPLPAPRGPRAPAAPLQKRSLVKNQRFFPVLNFSSRSFLHSLEAARFLPGSARVS